MGYRFYFNQRAGNGQGRGDCRSCRKMATKGVCIDRIEGGEIGQIGKPDSRFGDIGKCRPGLRQDGLQIGDSLARLFCYATFDQLKICIDAQSARAENKITNTRGGHQRDSRTVWQDGRLTDSCHWQLGFLSSERVFDFGPEIPVAFGEGNDRHVRCDRAG